MQIERAIAGVTTLGPGSRLVVWVNGCPRRCKGCVSPRLQASAPQNERDVIAFLRQFDLSDADGVTVSGGEPFLQTEELWRMVRYLRGQGVEDILVYTGYTLGELRARHDAATDGVLAAISVLIDGPYREEENSGKGNLKGSDNQCVHIFREELRARYEAYSREERAMQEFHFGGYTVAAGIPTAQYIAAFRRDEDNGGR